MGVELLNMDCMEYMAGLKDKAFDLAICDVEYGINVANMSFLKERSTSIKQKNGTKINGNRSKTIYALKDWDKRKCTQQYIDELNSRKRDYYNTL